MMLNYNYLTIEGEITDNNLIEAGVDVIDMSDAIDYYYGEVIDHGWNVDHKETARGYL